MPSMSDPSAMTGGPTPRGHEGRGHPRHAFLHGEALLAEDADEITVGLGLLEPEFTEAEDRVHHLLGEPGEPVHLGDRLLLEAIEARVGLRGLGGLHRGRLLGEETGRCEPGDEHHGHPQPSTPHAHLQRPRARVALHPPVSRDRRILSRLRDAPQAAHECRVIFPTVPDYRESASTSPRATTPGPSAFRRAPRGCVRASPRPAAGCAAPRGQTRHRRAQGAELRCTSCPRGAPRAENSTRSRAAARTTRHTVRAPAGLVPRAGSASMAGVRDPW